MYSQTLLKFNLLYCLFQYQLYNLVIKADILQCGLILKTDLQKWLVGFNIPSFGDSDVSFCLQMKVYSLPDSLADMTQLKVQFSSLLYAVIIIRIYGDHAECEPGQL